MNTKTKLLILGDSPTVNTGFANVVRNLSKHWQPHFPGGIHIWSINYNGWPHEYPYKLYPAGYHDWATGTKLSQFLNLLYAGDFTHLFTLCDAHNLTGDVAKHLSNVLKKRDVHFTMYYPVDAPMDSAWLDCVSVADAPVTYTEYGRLETIRAKKTLNPKVIPHGVDTTVFFPKSGKERLEIRQKLFNGWVKPDDILFVNVNRNERRKAIPHTMQIIKGLLERGMKAKLYLHMPKVAQGEMVDLELVGDRIGLNPKAWSHGDSYFIDYNPRASEEGVNDIYNAADFCISTTLGEGWGFSFSESTAAGCQVIAPDNTSCREIGRLVQKHSEPGRFTLLPLAPNAVTNMIDSSRVRYPVDIPASVDIISKIPILPRFVMPPELTEHLSWKRIAEQFAVLMNVK